MKGLIYKIEKYNTQSGPGFRTAVYMKGCNLQCDWCEQPIAQQHDREITFDRERCTMCFKCTSVCNTRLIAENNNQVFECTKCGDCASVCPTGAKQLAGEEYTPEELVEAIMPEMESYRASGGGVTFTGGEPVIQDDFLLETMKLLKERDVNIALKTSGNVDYSLLEKFVPYVDYIIYHLITANPETHRKFTGIDNELAIENLKKISFLNPEVICHINFIGGVNCNAEEARELNAFLSKLELYGVVIKGYDENVAKEYALVGRTLPREFAVPKEKTLENIRKLLINTSERVEILS